MSIFIIKFKRARSVRLNAEMFSRADTGTGKHRVSSVWPPGLNAFESIVIYDRNAQLFQSFLGQLKKILHQTVFFCSI